MRIALVPLNPLVGHLEHNFNLMLGHIKQAINKDCDLIIFPELAIIGYPPKDYLFYKILMQKQGKVINRLKRLSKDIVIVTGGIGINKSRGCPFKNQAFVLKNGQLLTYTKQLLPNYDVFDEQRYFEPGNSPLVFRVCDKRFAITICEDIWPHDTQIRIRYHKNPATEYKNLRIDFLINISASPFELDKAGRRKEILTRVARELKCPVIYVNQVGGNDDLVFDGGACVYNAAGHTILQSPLFEEGIFIYNTNLPGENTLEKGLSTTDLLKKALITGTRDYCHKTGFKQVVLGLSGGIDSALVACIAVEALGAENVLGLMLPSRYSSKGSVIDAQRLGDNLGMKTQKVEINTIHKAYEKIFRHLFKNKTSDITAQNIQARIRANILMAVSNNTGRLLLNTSNKSEAAMGYGTLYGDMCGALAVIGDLTKTQVYELCHHINRHETIIPKEIINKAPSAELKPNQKDTDSLPPYDILDPILEKFIDNFMINNEALNANHTSLKVIQKVLQNEYKRYQAPPGLKVTGKAFGTGRRFPIAAKINIY